MAANYKRYLAEKVLSDQEYVTYRSLSRALKVHCNKAKRMLFEFHRTENAKTPKSINATYLITGTRKQPQEAALNGNHPKDGEDEVMQSSPFMSSQVEPQHDVEDAPSVTAILLVREEDLLEVKNQFTKVSSIFVYSVQPTPMPDLNVLADIGYCVSNPESEDPLQSGLQYGMIQNRNVKRRTGAPVPRPAPAAAPAKKVKSGQPVSKEASTKSEKKEPIPVKQEDTKDIGASSDATSQQQKSSQASTKQSQGRPSSKREASNIFKAFAKTKPKAKKEEEASTPGAESDVPSAQEKMLPDEESEEEREDLFLDTGTRTSNKARESRKEREEKLRSMFDDDDDEEMADAPEPPPEEPTAEDTEMQTEEQKEQEPAPVESRPASNRRRRGRRQVMKKKSTRDAEGYLVTKEEPVWESFSEDEAPAAPAPKKKPTAPSAGKQAKGAAKGQGSIMAFFGKK